MRPKGTCRRANQNRIGTTGMRTLFALFLLLIAGCGVEITELKPLLPIQQRISAHETVDSFLKHHYTAKAYEALKDIPVVDGPCQTPYVAGVNFWTNATSLFSGIGVGRKVVVRSWMISQYGGTKVLFHEYLHHLDDMTRDGEGDFIDLKEFKEAYERLATDRQYAGIVIYAEKYSYNWWSLTFGIGEMSEHIAYSGSIAYINGAPTYFKRVFRKVFKRWETIR